MKINKKFLTESNCSFSAKVFKQTCYFKLDIYKLKWILKQRKSSQIIYPEKMDLSFWSKWKNIQDSSLHSEWQTVLLFIKLFP